MTYDDIIRVLTYACDNDQPVRIETADGQSVSGVPTNVDPEVAAHEVYLKPAGDEETEIVVSLAAVRAVEVI